MRQNTSFEESDLDWMHRPVPIFDTVKALIDVGANGSPRDVLIAHDCIKTVVYSNKSDMDYMNYLSLLVSLDDLFDNSRAKEISPGTLANHNVLFFHRKIMGSQQREGAPKSVVELCVNTTRALMADGAKPLAEIWLLPLSPLTYFSFSSRPGEHK